MRSATLRFLIFFFHLFPLCILPSSSFYHISFDVEVVWQEAEENPGVSQWASRSRCSGSERFNSHRSFVLSPMDNGRPTIKFIDGFDPNRYCSNSICIYFCCRLCDNLRTERSRSRKTEIPVRFYSIEVRSTDHRAAKFHMSWQLHERTKPSSHRLRSYGNAHPFGLNVFCLPPRRGLRRGNCLFLCFFYTRLRIGKRMLGICFVPRHCGHSTHVDQERVIPKSTAGKKSFTIPKFLYILIDYMNYVVL